VPALKEVLLNLVPTNPFDSLAKGDILPVIVFAMFFGIAAALSGNKGKAVVGAVDAAAEAMYKRDRHLPGDRRPVHRRHLQCAARFYPVPHDILLATLGSIGTAGVPAPG